MAVKEYCQYFRSAVEAKPAVVGVGTENSLSLPTEVLTRSGSLLLTKLPSSRRGHQPKHVGFFSPVNQPYRSFGSLPESHVFEWLAHSFEIKPPKYMYSVRFITVLSACRTKMFISVASTGFLEANRILSTNNTIGKVIYNTTNYHFIVYTFITSDQSANDQQQAERNNTAH